MGKKNIRTTSDYLSYEDYEKLLNGLHNDQEYLWELYAVLGFCTACRASDILTMKWGDVLNKQRCSVVEQKTGKVRDIYFSASTRKKIAQIYDLHAEPDLDEYIFANRITRQPMTIQYVNQKLKRFKYRYAIKVGNFSTHTFRKTFGRYVYEKNNRSAEALILLNTIFRHTSIDTTKVYIGITQDEINKVYNSIKF